MADPTNALAEYILPSKYARKLEGTNRLETFAETVDRVRDMHYRRFPALEEEISSAFQRVQNKQVLPSMRAMQFAGKAVETKNARQYNCAATALDRMRAFAEALWLSLCGTGVGFSVQKTHVENLPPIASYLQPSGRVHTVADTIEGWSEALLDLMQSAVEGEDIVFDFSLVRPKGAPLKTSGGRAPGPEGLILSLQRVREILVSAVGRKLKPIECYDIVCHAVDAVLSGGIRRSALICLFDVDDEEMINAKTGDWYTKFPWRQNSNNSAVLLRGAVTKEQFEKIYWRIKEWGEPGFLFSDDPDHLTNPCVEAGLYPFLDVSEEDRLALADKGVSVRVGAKLSGWQMCNLTEINVAACTSKEEFFDACKAAAFIGTLQATYTDLTYLGPISERIVRRDALLGVGLTGILDNPEIGLSEATLKEGANIVVQTNRAFARKLGINPSPRTTLIKPSGTSALVLQVSSGIGAHHADRYIRRVTATDTEQVFLAFKEANPEWCVKKPNGDYVIEFPVVAPPGAILLQDLSARSFLSLVLDVQRAWVQPGQAPYGPSHNVSNTIVVKEDEWDALKEDIWNNRQDIRGISLLPFVADKQYPFAPREAITTEEDQKRWQFLLQNYIPVDYTLVEADEIVPTALEPACASGTCYLN